MTRSRAAAALITLVYVVNQLAQLSLTPLGEGMDFYGHLAYVAFFAREGRAPLPDEPSVPAWIAELQARLPGPDESLTGSRYRHWLSLSPAERAAILYQGRPIPPTAPYTGPNYQSQHPPLYYGLASVPYRLLAPRLPLVDVAWLLGAFSILLSALAFPGLYLIFRRYLDHTPSLFALLVVAWYPNLLPFLGRITNDSLAFPLVTWTVYFCLRLLESGARLELLLAALCLTLAGFTKTYALVLWPTLAACALFAPGAGRAARAGLALALALGGTGALFLFNYLATGHVILLHQIRATDATPLLERALWILRLDPVWFFGGLVKGFWWSGYWSFISPGWLYYAPLGALGWLALKRPLRPAAALGSLWPHLLAIAGFVGGMLWHAANFKLMASAQGQTVHSGNEGWYANVLLGSVTALLLILVNARVAPAALRRGLVCAVAFFILWGLWARGALILYWSGLVGVEGRLRGIVWGEAVPALGNPALWDNWQTLPGLTPAGLGLGAALLAAAIGVSLALTIGLARNPGPPGREAAARAGG